MIIIRLFLVLVVIAVSSFVIVGIAVISSVSHCQSLIADGYDVVQVQGNCYANVGGGKYMALYNEGEPRTINEIIADKERKKERAFAIFEELFGRPTLREPDAATPR